MAVLGKPVETWIEEYPLLQDMIALKECLWINNQYSSLAQAKKGLPLGEVSKMLSLTPARVIGVADRKGSLEIGKDADIVVMTPDFQIAAVAAASGEIHRA